MVALLVVLEFAVQDASAWWQDHPDRRPGHRAVAEVIGSEYRPGDSVLTFDPDGYLTSRYYLGSKARPLYLAEGDDYLSYEGIVAFTGADRVSASELSDRVRGRVWVITGDKARRKESYIPEDWKLVDYRPFEDAAYHRRHAYLRRFATGTHATH
jgi:hypothetical protein